MSTQMNLTYEWDPTTDKKKFVYEVASSGRAKCIRCLDIILQGSARLGFEHWGNQFPITRWLHAGCFCDYPPAVCKRITQVEFPANALHEHVQEITARFPFGMRDGKTSEVLLGLRAEGNFIKMMRGVTSLPPSEMTQHVSRRLLAAHDVVSDVASSSSSSLKQEETEVLQHATARGLYLSINQSIYLPIYLSIDEVQATVQY
jgi:hypothetical protein